MRRQFCCTDCRGTPTLLPPPFSDRFAVLAGPPQRAHDLLRFGPNYQRVNVRIYCNAGRDLVVQIRTSTFRLEVNFNPSTLCFYSTESQMKNPDSASSPRLVTRHLLLTPSPLCSRPSTGKPMTVADVADELLQTILSPSLTISRERFASSSQAEFGQNDGSPPHQSF